MFDFTTARNDQHHSCALKFAQEIKSNGFTIIDFPENLRQLMLENIWKSLARLHPEVTLDDASDLTSFQAQLMGVPDSLWAERMNRAFRIFDGSVASELAAWGEGRFRAQLGRSDFAVNVVKPEEFALNSALTKESLAIYWRCVRPGKDDAGRPHRDASFWEIELEDEYDPGLPFQFHPIADCLKIWIPLYGCTNDTCLQVIPGSHSEKIPTEVVPTEYGRRPTISSQWLIENTPRFYAPPDLQLGKAIIFDMETVHRGPKHNANTVRISAELNLIFK